MSYSISIPTPMKLAKGVSLRCRNNRYSIRFYDKKRIPTQVERTLETDSGPHAKRLADRLTSRYILGQYDPWKHKANPLTVEQSLALYLKHRSDIRPSSHSQLRTTLGVFVHRLPLSSRLEHVQSSDIQSFVYERGLKPSTRCTVYEITRSWLNWCVVQGLILENPALVVKRPRKPKTVPRYLTHEQLDQLLTTIEFDSTDRNVMWFRDAVELAATTGLRKSELYHLRWRDIASGYLTVQSWGDYRAKGDSHGVVPVIPRVAKLIARLESERTNEDPYALVIGGTYHMIGPLFLKYRQKAALPDDVRFHDLRHTFAVMCRMAGIGVADLDETDASP